MEKDKERDVLSRCLRIVRKVNEHDLSKKKELIRFIISMFMIVLNKPSRIITKEQLIRVLKFHYAEKGKYYETLLTQPFDEKKVDPLNDLLTFEVNLDLFVHLLRTRMKNYYPKSLTVEVQQLIADVEDDELSECVPLTLTDLCKAGYKSFSELEEQFLQPGYEYF